MEKKQKKEQVTENIFTEVRSLTITRVHEGRKGLIFFDMIINGVFINGMSVVAGERGDFLSFPSHKGNDGNWYHYAWVKLSPEDQKTILRLVQTRLDE